MVNNLDYENGLIDAATIVAKSKSLPVSVSYDYARLIWIHIWQLRNLLETPDIKDILQPTNE